MRGSLLVILQIERWNIWRWSMQVEGEVKKSMLNRSILHDKVMWTL